MLELFNTLDRKIEPFVPVNNDVVNIFTCGPSVYQRSHIGNYRTFLFEDILVRYLEYLGYRVQRGMNFTDVEDKAIDEAVQKQTDVLSLTDKNISIFLDEMKLLKVKIPDYLPRASEYVDQAAAIIGELLKKGIAYWYGGNVYFDPLKFPGFGKLYGLDMAKWPKKKIRFHKDTYPGMQWNLGDFILWHGYKEGDPLFWDTSIGKGRPSWNIEDPAMISSFFNETLSIYCGGIDNLYRHHDYIIAILESFRPYPAARFWLHGHHLYVNGQKMSKSKNNYIYPDTLLNKGYSPEEIRFFLIYGHYRERLNYTEKAMQETAEALRAVREQMRKIQHVRGTEQHKSGIAQKIKDSFTHHMNADLHVRNAFDEVSRQIMGIDVAALTPGEAASITEVMREIDKVLNVIF